MKKIIYLICIFLIIIFFANLAYNKIENKKNIYNEIPEKIDKELWYKPKPGITWQWQLQGKINTNYDVDLYNIDLFDTPQSIIDELHNKNIKVICYMSTGTFEDWREDKNNFSKAVIGKDHKEWQGEKWLDISNYEKFQDVMLARLNLAMQKKCDGIEPDNIDSYKEDTGFQLTYEDQIKYNIWLANEAHKRNLSIALKNSGEQVKDLIQYYDFAIVEECFKWNECEPFKLFIEQKKAVLGVEYDLEINEFCQEANSLNFSWLKMNYDLSGERISCI